MSGLSHMLLHMSQPYVFSGRTVPYEDARYVVLGVPYDRTSTYRSGSRFAPYAIREASANIETYSMRTGVDVEDLRICDAGDLNVTDNPKETIERIRLVVGKVLADSKIPIMLGGEHTISLGGVRAAGVGTTVVDFDAHMDFRNEYNGEYLSHASVMKRISEDIGSDQIVQIGTRAVCKEEMEFARDKRISTISTLDLHRKPIDSNLATLRSVLDARRKLYVTLDIDVLDPAYAPAVSNPEADGLSPDILLSLLQEVCRHNVIAIDLTEMAPHYDTGATAVQAARLLFESLCYIESQARKEP